MLEAQAHSQLRYFLRKKQHSEWKHHLTMTRMVARGLRLKRPAIIQTGVNHEQYFPSYLIPALLSDSRVIIVTDKRIQKILIKEKIPLLQQSLNTNRFVSNNYEANIKKKSFLFVVDYQTWVEQIFTQSLENDITTIIIEADQLPQVIKKYLTEVITGQELYELAIQLPKYQDFIREKLAKLTQLIFAHPSNPYDSYLLDKEEINIINDICNLINNEKSNIFSKFINFQSLLSSNKSYIGYFTMNCKEASFRIKAYPLELKSLISHLWKNNNFIFLANYLDSEKYSLDYSDELGFEINQFTCLKITPSSHNQCLKLYFTNNLPFPNHPDFFNKVNQEILALVGGIKVNHHPIIIIIDDLPLQSQIATCLSAIFGSRVQLNKTKISQNTILVCDINFWLKNQIDLLQPQLLIMPTLPIPSLENPLISAQVTYYKNRKKDWFRLFLLPYTIKILQKATISLRKKEGILAVFDNRVNYRSYGTQILQILEPYAKIDYLDLDWFN